MALLLEVWEQLVRELAFDSELLALLWRGDNGKDD
eukprot:CAMPEP_0184751576 /NCGR_PEP_ID=MMETSP0315-20130426/43118_1 /TAXON_ID=101924 /ORGANISM="Rhodosorus marinus, Strain UTEX LB 2760" /LENGTH=34 /DNA_ID= /DNA_START= /DNA_END= /DNA_ORIENTATION=